MERINSLENEVHAILGSPSFERSPSLARILGYLLARELAGSAAPNQYDIAVQALGKGDSFDEVVDSSVRVQMSRLRKALSDYYLTHQPIDGLYVHVRSGEYRLRSSRLETAYPDIAAATDIGRSRNLDRERGNRWEEGESIPSPHGEAWSVSELFRLFRRVIRLGRHEKNRVLTRAAAAIAALATFGIYFLASTSAPTPATALARGQEGVTSPDIAFTIDAPGGLSERRDLIERADSMTRELLHKSMISRLSNKFNEDGAQYHLSVKVQEQSASKFSAFIVLTDYSGAVISERSLGPSLSELDLLQGLNDEVTSIISPAGHLVRHIARKISKEPRSGFECFVLFESQRAKGEARESLLDHCISKFSDDEYAPYLRTRRAFSLAQRRMLEGGVPGQSNPEWITVTEVLSDHPDNPYANTLAAKLLISHGRCDEAVRFVENASSRGQTYPALELMIVVDGYGCKQAVDARPRLKARIKRIAASNTDPHMLLDSYILLGAIVSGQEDNIKDGAAGSFSYGGDEGFADLNRSLRAAKQGRGSTEDLKKIDSMLPALIFNPDTRVLISQRIRERNTERNNK